MKKNKAFPFSFQLQERGERVFVADRILTSFFIRARFGVDWRFWRNSRCWLNGGVSERLGARLFRVLGMFF
jgi:hypothetical protein